jgi:SAM-dependent methyltransferase
MKNYRAIAEYYDAENESIAMLREDVPFFIGQLPRRPRQTVLELAAGTGRAAIPIAQAGYAVTAVDYAADMLAIARRKRDAVGLGDAKLRLIEADVLNLDLGQTFDWICILFNTFLGFTTLDQQDRALQAIRKHLKPTGRFWLDIFQPDFSLLSRERSVDLSPKSFFVPQFDRTVFQTTEVRRNVATQVQRVTFHYNWFDARGREHRQRNAFDMTYIFPRELQLLLERNGLQIERLFGNYDGSPLTPHSPRMIARCTRSPHLSRL